MPEASRLGPAEVNRFCELIHGRSGLHFPPSRLADLEHVIADTLASTGMRDFEALFTLLTDGTSGEPILQEMISDLTVGETYFFRNQPQFHALEHHILPELIARRRGTRHLRIWSAGCASGEEPYSLAILLERLLPDLADWSIHLLATDINPTVLAKAQRGRYGEWSFRHVPTEIKETYFLPHATELEIRPRLRGRVTFARLNLAEDAFPSFLTHTCDMDLILCRNVLIYFRPETVKRIVDHFYRALSPDGWLIVGHAEPSQVVFAQFAARNFPGTVVYRKEPLVAQSQPAVQEIAFQPPLELWVPPTDRAPPERPAKFERAPPRQDPAPPPAEPAPYRKAKDLADRRQWDEAEKWIAAALQEEPLCAPAHYLHGLILLEQAEPEAALASLRRCIFADADFVLGHLALADLLGRQGQTERARKALEAAGRLMTDRPTHELIPEGDGLTAGRLLEIINMRKQS